MTVIVFPKTEGKDGGPTAEFLTADNDGRQMLRFFADYRFDGRPFSVSFWAYNMQDAERRVASMRRNLCLEGQLLLRGEIDFPYAPPGKGDVPRDKGDGSTLSIRAIWRHLLALCHAN
ncbi:hypothetical protein QA646_25205 (plasmid) [Rhizobium sp. CB3090]|uniref:hypothetical protein n=1 Tax=Rhizobium sp. CB3090 TaxID=3039156 RepID=UPI0024B1EAE3|nr:hypothetical protein [Rhizobium sp. CB3090]WFU11682.1 hypothetical protein QA646_25205 [Rhizobium sp. CB3090]